MGIFSKLCFGKKARAASQNAKRVEELHGQLIKYVTERVDGNDSVVGRGGSISLRDGQLLLFSSEKNLMRADASTVDASYLLSGDGVVLTAPNLEDNGKMHSYIAYFVYYRK